MDYSRLNEKVKPELSRLSSFMENNDIKQSLITAEKILEIFEKNKPVFDDSAEYIVFSEPFEEALYMQIFKPQKKVVQIPNIISEVYFRCGATFFAADRKEEGLELLKKAYDTEPTNFTIAITYIETFKMLENYEEYFQLSIDAFNYAFKPKDIARVYRNLGYYFTEKKLYNESYACYILSKQYDDSEKCEMEVDFLNNVSGNSITEPTNSFMKEFGSKYNIPTTTNQNIIGLAYAYGKHFYDAHQMAPAKYFLNIAYLLTKEIQLKDLIDSL